MACFSNRSDSPTLGIVSDRSDSSDMEPFCHTTVNPNEPIFRETFIGNPATLSDIFDSVKRIHDLTDKQVAVAYKLYQVWVFIVWQRTHFKSRDLRADEWLVEADEALHPILVTFHSKRHSLGAGTGRFYGFPQIWMSFGKGGDKGDAAEEDLYQTILKLIGVTPALFTQVKPFREVTRLIEGTNIRRELRAGFFIRNQFDEPTHFAIRQENPIETWLEAVESLDPKDDDGSQVFEDESEADDHITDILSNQSEPARDPLAIAFDPEHNNPTISESIISPVDDIEYFTDARAFCARLRNLISIGALDKSSPEFGDFLQLSMRGSALWWMVIELTEDVRDVVRTSLSTFARALMRRFPEPYESEALGRFLYREELTVAKVGGCSDLLRMRLLQLCRLAQLAGVAEEPRTYLLIWNRMEDQIVQFFENPDWRHGDYDDFVEKLDKGLKMSLRGEEKLPEELNGSDMEEEGGEGSACMCTVCCAEFAAEEEGEIDANPGFKLRPWLFLPVNNWL